MENFENLKEFKILLEDSNKDNIAQISAVNSSILSAYKIVVRKIMDIGGRWKLDVLTLHIAVKILSNYLLKKGGVRDKEKMALIALLIAAKYNQTDITCISLNTLRREAIGRYSREELIQGEKYFLEFLKWELNVITPFDFLFSFSQVGIIFKSEFTNFGDEGNDFSSFWEISKRILSKSIEKLNTVIKDPRVITIEPQILALFCVVNARKDFNIIPAFSENFAVLYDTSKFLIQEWMDTLNEFSTEGQNEINLNEKKTLSRIDSKIIRWRFEQRSPEETTVRGLNKLRMNKSPEEKRLTSLTNIQTTLNSKSPNTFKNLKTHNQKERERFKSPECTKIKFEDFVGKLSNKKSFVSIRQKSKIFCQSIYQRRVKVNLK